ncbi:TPA: hypothetical protein F3L22_07605 [Aeromonas hydrophila]|nr:hypothetical protein [Aeromonas hydrophila]
MSLFSYSPNLFSPATDAYLPNKPAAGWSALRSACAMVYHAGNRGAWHPHPGARRHRHRIFLSSNMSKTAHAGSEPTFYFHDYETSM